MGENKQYLPIFVEVGHKTIWLLFALQISVGTVIQIFRCCIEHLAFWF